MSVYCFKLSKSDKDTLLQLFYMCLKWCHYCFVFIFLQFMINMFEQGHYYHFCRSCLFINKLFRIILLSFHQNVNTMTNKGQLNHFYFSVFFNDCYFGVKWRWSKIVKWLVKLFLLSKCFNECYSFVFECVCH